MMSKLSARALPATQTLAVGLLIQLLGSCAIAEQTKEDPQRLARAVTAANISLEAAVSANERHGTPLPAEFEIERGQLQISVTVMKGKVLIEVTVDAVTGRISDVEELTEESKCGRGKGVSDGDEGGEKIASADARRCRTGERGLPSDERGATA